MSAHALCAVPIGVDGGEAGGVHLGHCSLAWTRSGGSYGDVPTMILTDYLTEATPAEEDVIEYVAVTTFSQLVS